MNIVMTQRSNVTARALDGKVSLVTGSTSGIGLGIARTLASAGADVVIASRKREACEAAAASIHAETGRRALPVECHVGRWDDCDRFLPAIGEIANVPSVMGGHERER